MKHKFVYNGHSNQFQRRDEAFAIAKQAGFCFMSWNGNIYHVPTETLTGITTKDLYD